MERVNANIYKDDELCAEGVIVILQFDEHSKKLPFWQGGFESDVHFDMRDNPHRIETSDGRKADINISSSSQDLTDMPISYEFVTIEELS